MICFSRLSRRLGLLRICTCRDIKTNIQTFRISVRMTEQFQQCAQYLDACYEAWKTVFDSYDRLVRVLRSLSPSPSQDVVRLLQEFKREIEEKKQELEGLTEENTERVRCGLHIENTPPLAFRIEFNLAKLIRAAWPAPTSTATTTTAAAAGPMALVVPSSLAATTSQIQPPPGINLNTLRPAFTPPPTHHTHHNPTAAAAPSQLQTFNSPPGFDGLARFNPPAAAAAAVTTTAITANNSTTVARANLAPSHLDNNNNNNSSDRMASVLSWVQSIDASANPATFTTASIAAGKSTTAAAGTVKSNVEKPISVAAAAAVIDDDMDDFETFGTPVAKVHDDEEDGGVVSYDRPTPPPLTTDAGSAAAAAGGGDDGGLITSISLNNSKNARRTLLSDLDDFDTFGPEAGDESSGGGGYTASWKAKQSGPAAGLDKKKEEDDLSAVLAMLGDDAAKHMRCVNFLTNKIKQKYGDAQQVALSKVYGHLSQEESYRMLIGGLREFPSYLAKFARFFRMSADGQHVTLKNGAFRESEQVLRKLEQTEAARKQQQQSSRKKEGSSDGSRDATSQQRDSAQQQQQSQQILSNKKAQQQQQQQQQQVMKMKASLLDMDEYDDSSSGEEARLALGALAKKESGGNNCKGKTLATTTRTTTKAVASGRGLLDELDDYDDFNLGDSSDGGVAEGGGGWQQMTTSSSGNKGRQQQQHQSHQAPLSSNSQNKQALTYWQIVELCQEKLELASKYGSAETGKAVAVEAVKMAMQLKNIADFGGQSRAWIVAAVEEQLGKASEMVTKKRQQPRSSVEEAAASSGVSARQLAEWKYKTTLCSDFTADGRCPRAADCVFAHGQHDLRPRRRVKLCPAFTAGTCRKAADECQGAHGNAYLGSILSFCSSSSVAQLPSLFDVGPALTTSVTTSSVAPVPAKSFWKATPGVAGVSGGGSTFVDTDDDCSICCNRMDGDGRRVQLLKCGHRFHKHCLQGWTSSGGTCPKCRAQIVDDTEFPSLIS